MTRSFLSAVLFLVSFQYSLAGYFQQEVNYRIKVTLDDRQRLLHGFLELEYINHSPDTLSFIWFHLWPNAYRHDSTALARQFLTQKNTSFYFTATENRGYIDSLEFRVNDFSARWSYHPEHIDICRVDLTEPLLPGKKIKISTPFKVKVPVAPLSRLGHYGDAFYITQWYPKPAVYDRSGWHPMPYLDQGEFYSEFGSFEVSITLPENYVVAATGVLQTESEKQWLDSLASETARLLAFSDDLSFPASSAKLKTLVYSQNNIHDFAWFADKRFHYLKSKVTLPNSERTVETGVFFTNANPHLWRKAATWIDSALYYYSLWNGDYPYDYCLAVDGEGTWGGMEYPMVTIIGKAHSEPALENVIVHEVGHNWFYGILGSNERDFAWIDEGINSFNEMRYMIQRYGKYQPVGSLVYGLHLLPRFLGLHNLTFHDLFLYSYLMPARRNEDQPPCLTSSAFTSGNYASIVYSKTALAFHYLMNYLGPPLFDSCMHRFFNEWKFKHPCPEDLQKHFEEQTGKNLSWFFDDLIGSNKKTDYAIVSVRPLRGENLINPSGHSLGFTIRNKGGIAGPLSFSALKNGEIQSTRWVEGFTGKKQFHISCAHCDEIRIDAGNDMPELNRNNNSARIHGLFRRLNPPAFRFLFGRDYPYRTNLYYVPVAGWNNYDKWMPGLAIHNRAWPDKNVEFSLMPLYSSGTKSIAGHVNLQLKIYPRSAWLQSVTLLADACRFAYERNKGNDRLSPFNLHYAALPVSLKLQLSESDALSPVRKFIELKNTSTFTDEWTYSGNQSSVRTVDLHYRQVSFSLVNTRLFDPYFISLTVENGERYTKAMTEIKYMICYRNPKKGLHLRGFAGVFLKNDETIRNYKFRRSGWSGYQDYKFEDWYFGRSETAGIWSQQMEVHDGGFKSFSFAGQSDKWLMAVNLAFDFPGRLPISVFADAGWVPKFKAGDFESEAFYYDGGISVHLIRDVAEIHIPLFRSDAIREAQEINQKKWINNIRFIFSIRKFGIGNLKNQIQLL